MTKQELIEFVNNTINNLGVKNAVLATLDKAYEIGYEDGKNSVEIEEPIVEHV